MSDEPDDLDLLAAEYVLGALDAETARAVEALAASSASVALSIEAWQNRLAPLAALADPMSPPAELWERIERQTRPPSPLAAPMAEPVPLRAGPVAMTSARRAGPATRAWRSPGVWRAATAASLALAASLAAIVVMRAPLPLAPRYVAALSPVNAAAPVFLARTESDGSVVVAALSAVDVAPGKDLELWALPEGAQKPISLGVLPRGGRRVALSDLPRARTQLLVSLEPAGGSPTGQPTGPVLFGGTLAAID